MVGAIVCPLSVSSASWGGGGGGGEPRALNWAGAPRWAPGVRSKVSSIIILLTPDFKIVYATLKRFAAST